MLKRIADILANKKHGLFYGNRVILPFHGYFLKIIIDNEIILNFSPASKDVCFRETEAFTEIYFLRYDNLKDVLSKYETIKLVVVEKDKDIFEIENHLRLALHLGENHTLIIEKTDEDILFVE